MKGEASTMRDEANTLAPSELLPKMTAEIGAVFEAGAAEIVPDAVEIAALGVVTGALSQADASSTHSAQAPLVTPIASIVSCDVCRDLMPLVRDGVASDDSAALVAAHTAGCEACRVMLETGECPPTLEQITDANIIRRLRKTLLLRSGLFALTGVVGGMLISKSADANAYILWWLPLVGMLSYFVMPRRWWLAPLLVGVLAALGHALLNLFTYGLSADILLVWPLYIGATWLFYTAVGTGVGALLHFAIGKDR